MPAADHNRLSAEVERQQASEYNALLRSILHLPHDDATAAQLDRAVRRLVFDELKKLLEAAYTMTLREHAEGWPGWKEIKGWEKFSTPNIRQAIYHEYLGYHETSVSGWSEADKLPRGLFFRLHFCVPERTVEGFGTARRAVTRWVAPKLLQRLRRERDRGVAPPLSWYDLVYLAELKSRVAGEERDHSLLLAATIPTADGPAGEALADRISAAVQAKAVGAPRKSRSELQRLWFEWVDFYDVVEDAFPDSLSLESVVDEGRHGSL